MSNRDPLAAEVLVAAEVSAEEEQAIVEAFCALGVTARTRMVPTRRGLEQLHWLLLATLPLHAFLSGLGSAAAENGAQGLKRLAGRVVGTKHEAVSSEQVLVLQDSATRLQIVLEADLPARGVPGAGCARPLGIPAGAGALRPPARRVALGAR